MNAPFLSAMYNMPLKRKLNIINMLTTSAALLLVCIAFMSYESLTFRAEMVRDLKATAAIVGDNSAAALSFDDPASAELTLRSLDTHVHVVGAAVYDKEGHLFATYRREAMGSFKAPLIEQPGSRFEGDFLKLFSGIELAGEKSGTVYLQSDLEEIRERMRRYAFISIAAALAAFGVAFLLSGKLQQGISFPIALFGSLVQRVSTEKDYSLRATKFGSDELGDLIDGFNDMLDQIQQRDHALQQAHADLEQRVDDRTKELARSLTLLNATLESSTDGIMAFEFTCGMVCCNTRYKQIWTMPDELLEPGADERRIVWIASQIKTPEDFLEQHRVLVEKKQTNAFDVLELKDGRVLERYLLPQHRDGKVVGIVASFRDVTERKHAERELANAHRQLLDSSRQAGMAEVATGVLHNVGNVLNSVNVSANLLSESVKGSKISSLAKVAALLEEHKEDCAAFIERDPRGRHLPQFLIQLSQHLAGEQRESIKELESLRNSIDHIKQIVTMQQAYSKVSGVKEVVNVIDLVEDALRLNESGLQRHGIRIMRAFEAAPALNTEKHKILQILVNLVRNAKFACTESGRKDKCVTLSVTQQDDLIRISVSDNGVGIAPDNITRIFSHGFTTRKDGHGFGLHSGALTARELGGALRAYSEGPSLGATFTLELPLAEELGHA